MSHRKPQSTLTYFPLTRAGCFFYHNLPGLLLGSLTTNPNHLVLLPKPKPPVGALIYQLKMNEYVRKSVHNFSYDMKQGLLQGYVAFSVFSVVVVFECLSLGLN